MVSKISSSIPEEAVSAFISVFFFWSIVDKNASILIEVFLKKSALAQTQKDWGESEQMQFYIWTVVKKLEGEDECC